MEFLGRETADVVSVACSSSSTTGFATLTGQGTLTLWDVRLKRKNYLSFSNPNNTAKMDAMELKYLADRHAAVALCGNTVLLYDTRKAISAVAEYVHATECVTFHKDTPPAGAATTLLIDEDGGMFPFSLTDGTRANRLDPYVFGKPYLLPTGHETFGHLDNYCSGLHSIDVRGEADIESTHVLFAVGMDGHGALYSCADNIDNEGSNAIKRLPFNIMTNPDEQQKVQVVNPPLVNCTTQRNSILAVGKADGTYTVYEMKKEGPEELFEAPGHAVNGLCYVDWFSADVLITASVCGEVTGWNVGAFMRVAAMGDEVEDEEEGDLPEVVTAFAYREVPGCKRATVNSGDRLNNDSYIFGDNMGGVALAKVEL